VSPFYAPARARGANFLLHRQVKHTNFIFQLPVSKELHQLFAAPLIAPWSQL